MFAQAIWSSCHLCTLHSIMLGQVQKKEAFVTKLDAVVIIDKFGAKVCLLLFVTI